MTFRILKLAACATLALAAATAQAATFPEKTVQLVVPQTPGGASDTLARIMGQELGTKWGQPVVVENRAGAGGNIGMEAVARAPADGYTLLMSYVGTHAINGSLYKTLPFDPEKDFAPVATLATLPFVVVTRTDAKFSTVPELVELAKKGELTYGSAGNGSVNHLLGEMFNAATGVKLVHIPYRGAAPALTDLMGGQIDLVFTSLPSVAGHINTGKLKAVALTSDKRVKGFDSIPTIAEGGYPDFNVNPWFGLFAPAGTPADVISKMNADINETLGRPEVRERFAATGAEPYVTSPAEFGDILRADIEKWSKVVEDSGAQVN
ncbi:tripartite tricarboxylate transporter substrate binding protein [Alcaligenaceae bacterium]|nr:tripartite tricarboxylate transporter substrate binding protein [Alcaligenaceae bacterium]